MGSATLSILAVFSGFLLAFLFGAPRLLLRRFQDRLARRLLEERGDIQLLTRAEWVVGKYRRVPGVVALAKEAVAFHGVFGEHELLPTSRIQKVVTGSRLASGRKLFRLEVLRLTRPGGDSLELVMTPASAGAWRSHLGLWAVHERKASMETVAPGRK
jgi:hypothetical protein